MAALPDFVPGESLVWVDTNPGNNHVTRRTVSFRGIVNNQCVVCFGLKSDFSGEESLFSVPASDLSRHITPQMTPAVVRHEPPPPPPLSQRRATLNEASASYREAVTLVEMAQALLDRAWVRLENSQRRLREFADLEQHAVDAVLYELRAVNGVGNGHSLNEDDAEWLERDRAKRECASAQSAYEVLARELSDAKSRASDRQEIVQQAAALVVAGILERETDRLVLLETETAQLRIELRAGQLLWLAGQPLPLGPVASRLLIEAPSEVHEGVGERLANTERRQVPFSDLFARLVAGETDSDLEN